MSMFSPNAWLSRSRLHSNSTADFSKESLDGLNFLQQTSPLASTQLQPSLSDEDRFSEHIDQEERKQPRRRLYSQQKSKSTTSDCDHEDDDEACDAFKADTHIPLRPHETKSLSLAQHKQTKNLEMDQAQVKSRHGSSRASSPAFGATLRQVPSFGNGSCISSLSADETNYELDDKTVKSLDLSLGNKHHGGYNHGHGHGHGQHRNRQSQTQTQTQTHRRISSSGGRGTDFCGAFDHLNHLINPVDLMGDDCENMLYMQHQQKLREQHHHRRAATAVPGPRLLSEPPRSLHQRSSSDTRAFRPKPLSLHKRSTSTSSRPVYSKSVAAHATVRECMNKTKGCDLNTSLSSHNRVLSMASKPQILASRSTSATVLSSTANTVSSNNPNQVIGVVWNGQPLENLIGSSSPSPSSRSLRRNQTIGAYGPNGSSSSPHRGHQQSVGSGTSFLDQDIYSVSNVSSTSNAGFRSTHTEKKIIHYRNNSDANSSLAKEQTTAVTDDRTTVSGSLGSTSTARSRRNKPSFKDEMKFILKKMVPSPLRHVATKKNKVNLERSRGCLT